MRVKLVNRTAALNATWLARAITASLLAGFMGYLPIFLYPRDVWSGWLQELVVPVLIGGVPSAIGSLLGRFWVPNLLAALGLATFTFLQGFWQASVICLSCGVLAAATMSFLGGRWNLVVARD